MAYRNRLRDLREDRDWTQKQMADKLYMQLTQYRRYETGERAIPLELACTLADTFGVSLDYLAGRTLYDASFGSAGGSGITDASVRLSELPCGTAVAFALPTSMMFCPYSSRRSAAST